MGNPYDLNHVAKIRRNAETRVRNRIDELQRELKRLGPSSPYDLSSRQAQIRQEIMRLVVKLNDH